MPISPSRISTPVQRSTSTVPTSSTSLFSAAPSHTGCWPSGTLPSPSNQPLLTRWPPWRSACFGTASLSTFSPGSTSSNSSSLFGGPTVPPWATNTARANFFTGGPHGFPREVVVVLAASLGLVLFAAVAAVSLIYLRRLCRRRRLRRSVERAYPADLCAPVEEAESAKDVNVFEGNTSRDTHAPNAGHPSPPSSSVIDISSPRTSVFVAPPSSPFIRQEECQQAPSTIPSQPSSEDQGSAKAATEPSVGADVPRPTRDLPIPPYSNPSSVPECRTGVPRTSRFVTVLKEVPDEEERELPPPYEPGSQAIHDATPRQESRTYGDV
ncbi:hypothetical protein TRAPUB_8953 [Trametes pubescens]|uniref:Uncharacterized protein n=1 Tax=Trametes pubescens TaxID=154538 RepID=A0A1M2W3R4_TRAPU|nr:hypothetical protein TRAPUB_8953 [Trametes pubescens]